VQQYFQQTFETWGLPEVVRFDNGAPWAAPQSRTPTSLALWLVGLGIRLVFGRPRQSTDNAVVERSHGVLNGWVEPQTCADRFDLQQRLDHFVHIQRALYPDATGEARLTRYPDLLTPLRRYHHHEDEQLWDLQRVWDYVATYHFSRTVEKNGRITLLTREYWIGRSYAAQKVTAFLDPKTGYWQIEDQRGEVVGQFPAQQLNYLTISTMNMTYRRGKSRCH
jgi:hypothetical protein